MRNYLWNLMLKYKYFIVSGLIFGMYYLPVLILGEDCYVRIHDNLDGAYFSGYMLINVPESVPYYQNGQLMMVMNGLPRALLYSYLNVVAWLVGLLPPLTAYLINDFFIRIIGFAGMFLLLKKYVIYANGGGRKMWLYFLVPYYSHS
jgi:hypothetical protein